MSVLSKVRRINRYTLTLAAQVAMLLVLMTACAALALKRFDEYGDELCHQGKLRGPDLCPPERFAPGELPGKGKFEYVSTSEPSGLRLKPNSADETASIPTGEQQ